MKRKQTRTVAVRDGSMVESDDDLYSFHDPNHPHFEGIPSSELRTMSEAQARSIGCHPCSHCFDTQSPYVVEL